MCRSTQVRAAETWTSTRRSGHICLYSRSNGLIIRIKPSIPDSIHALKVLLDIFDPNKCRQQFWLIGSCILEQRIYFCQYIFCLSFNITRRWCIHLSPYVYDCIVNYYLAHVGVVKSQSLDGRELADGILTGWSSSQCQTSKHCVTGIWKERVSIAMTVVYDACVQSEQVVRVMYFLLSTRYLYNLLSLLCLVHANNNMHLTLFFILQKPRRARVEKKSCLKVV